jgi:hypothetical protein
MLAGAEILNHTKELHTKIQSHQISPRDMSNVMTVNPSPQGFDETVIACCVRPLLRAPPQSFFNVREGHFFVEMAPKSKPAQD